MSENLKDKLIVRATIPITVTNTKEELKDKIITALVMSPKTEHILCKDMRAVLEVIEECFKESEENK